MIVVSEATGTRLQDKGFEITLPGYSVYFPIFVIPIGEEVILFPRSSQDKDLPFSQLVWQLPNSIYFRNPPNE